MKKTLALLLALVMVLSLCACGGKSETATTTNSSETQASDVLDKNDTSNYFGVWETEHYRLTINKGGVGRYEPISNATGHYDLEWEIKDEVLVTRISFAGMENKAVLELSDDSSSLVASTMGFPAFVEGENVFVKQP